MSITLPVDVWTNLTNSMLDHYIKGPPIAQSLQDRPFLKALRERQKMFPGGKDLIRGNVKGDYTTTFMGYQYDDAVTYANPANIKQFSYEWGELHAGIGFSGTELKRAGITVTDSMTGESTALKPGSDANRITNILTDKLDDMMEGAMRSFNDIVLRDGTQSSKIFAGLQAIVRGTPTSGVVGGIDSGLNAWWRNRALVGTANRITPSRANSTLIQTLRNEARQLMRYGGRPNLLIAGSNFMQALETEVTAKGQMTQTGFTGKQDVDIGDIAIARLGTFKYEPSLDDLGLTNFCYMLDMRHLMLHTMEGEDMKTHAPARPHDKYVYYRAITYTGTLVANKLNCHGVYEINPTYS